MEDIVELGEIIALRKGRGKGRAGLLTREHVEKVNRFVSEGFVVYKSVDLFKGKQSL